MIGVWWWAALYRLRLWWSAGRMVPDAVPRLSDTQALFEHGPDVRRELLPGLGWVVLCAGVPVLLLAVGVLAVAAKVGAS